MNECAFSNIESPQMKSLEQEASKYVAESIKDIVKLQNDVLHTFSMAALEKFLTTKYPMTCWWCTKYKSIELETISTSKSIVNIK